MLHSWSNKWKIRWMQSFFWRAKCAWCACSQPLWDVSQRFQSDLQWERHVRDLSQTSQKKWLFCDVFKTSQKRLEKDVFCVTSLRRLEHISKNILEVFVIFQKYPTKMASRDFLSVVKISDKVDLGPLETLKK